MDEEAMPLLYMQVCPLALRPIGVRGIGLKQHWGVGGFLLAIWCGLILITEQMVGGVGALYKCVGFAIHFISNGQCTLVSTVQLSSSDIGLHSTGVMPFLNQLLHWEDTCSILHKGNLYSPYTLVGPKKCGFVEILLVVKLMFVFCKMCMRRELLMDTCWDS